MSDAAAPSAHDRLARAGLVLATLILVAAVANLQYLQGDQWASTAGVVSILLGAALVWLMGVNPLRGSARLRWRSRSCP